MIFKPKQSPVLSWSRFVHLLCAAGVTAYGGHLWGYEGSVWACFGIIVVGFGWEVSNRFTKGWHPYADALDFLAFAIGAITTCLMYVMTR